jgi:hypothetical protein
MSAGGYDFAARCPRLSKAHRERQAELYAERAERRRVRNELLKLERLVAHRELQELRATQRNRRYYAHRARKLDQARRDLERVRAHAQAIGA